MTKLSRAFKERILKKAKIKAGTVADNIKLGNMGSWGELPGDCDWFIPELNYTMHGTCGEHCKGCFDCENPRNSQCYVFNSYLMYTNRNEDGTPGDIQRNKCSVKLGHAYRTIAMLLFRDELLVSLDMQLTRKRDKFKVVRINESGELTCYEDLAMWCELARRHSETVFYLYTKNYKAVKRAVNEGVIGDNIFINISIWHENGIAEYLEIQHHKQIRAFVVVDDEWTVGKYREHGLNITTMCGAYDMKGKMNHSVTCDKCKKCFSGYNKCCGCYLH